MKKKLIFIMLIVINVLCISNIYGNIQNKYSISCVYANQLSSAKGMCVLEQSTNKILYSKNKDAKLANASTTKIITAITVVENCKDLQEVIVVNNKAVGIEGTSIYLKRGEKLKVIDLLYGLMLRSGNDSACALAYHVGGTMEKFITLMNETCQKAGAINSHFSNPHGLDEKNHYTTAYDLALITSYAMKNSIFKEIVSSKKWIIPETNMYETRYLVNKNKLLNNLDGCVGVKTGFTDDAGRCLVSAVERNGMTLICVVLNCGPMFEESARLLNTGFSEYVYAKIVEKDKVIYNEYYINKIKGCLNLTTKESYYLPLNYYEIENVIVKYQLYELKGNRDEGEEVGEINVFIDNHLQKTIKLYTINKIDVVNEQDVISSIKLQWEEKYEIK